MTIELPGIMVSSSGRDNFRTSFTHSTFSLIDTILLSTSHDVSGIVKLLGGSQIICYVLKQIRLTGFSRVLEGVRDVRDVAALKVSYPS